MLVIQHLNHPYASLADRDAEINKIISTINDTVFSGIGAYWPASRLQDLGEYLYTALSNNCFDQVILMDDPAIIGTVTRNLAFDEFTLSVNSRTLVVYINPDYLDS